MFPDLSNRIKPQNETFEVFEVNIVCPNRTLGLQIDGKRPPFSVKPVKLPATETEIEEGNTLVGIDDWAFSAKTEINEVLKTIRKVMASDQPVIKLVLQREKAEFPQLDGQTWTCQRCTIVNAVSESICNTCGLTKTESTKRLNSKNQTDWKCSSCTYENPSDQQKCVMCETERSLASQQQNEYMPVRSNRMTSEEQLKKALELSAADGQNTYQNQAMPYQNQGQYGEPMMMPNYQEMPNPPSMQNQQRMLSYNQWAPPQQQRPQQDPYMQQFPQDMQQEPNAQAYPGGQQTKVSEPRSAERQFIPEREPSFQVLSWKCQLCTTTNDAETANCTTCRAPRISEVVEAEPDLKQQTAATNSTSQQKGRWKCPYCLYENNGSTAQCLMCSRSPPKEGNFAVVADPKEALETLDREKIAMAWLQKQLIVENRCRVGEFDAAFRRSNNRVTEAIFRLTSGFTNLDTFKSRLERFIGGQVGSLKRMGKQMDGRLQQVDSELQKVGTRYQETTEFFNKTQQEVDEKTYLKPLTDKLESLNGQEEELLHRLKEIKAEKDNVTLKMRSEQINKKLQAENCERVMKQLQLQLGFLKTEKNELDVQEQIIRDQVNNYEEMKRALENVKLNDLKSTIKIFQSPEENQKSRQQEKSATTSVDLLDLPKTNDSNSRRSRGARVNLLPAMSSLQSTPELKGEPQSHQTEQNDDDFLHFFSGTGENSQSSVPKDEEEKLFKEKNDDTRSRS